ncbi:MAG: hypothetical protein LUF92_01600 [Clostridiales bacterium]|nr:hypothetical protein [Clostridiales bacterium]
MYKIKIEFDTNSLQSKDIDKICEDTDQIFEVEDLICSIREPGKRVYLDQGREQDYGRFWAAIFALKDNAWITKHLQTCYWYNGNTKENLMTEFLLV